MALRRLTKYFENTTANNFEAVILGCQRSGTTLLKEVLNTGEIFMFEENWILPYFYRERWHACGVWHREIDVETEEQAIWDGAVRMFVENSYGVSFRKNRQARHRFWGAKSPGLNMARTSKYLKKIFTGLKFIILVRDPRDTFASMQASPNMISYLPENFYRDAVNSPDLLELSNSPHSYWGMVYSELDVTASLFPNSCYIMKYEDLLKNPLERVRDLCSFLSIPFSSEMLEPFTRRISNASTVSMSYEDYLAGNFSISGSAVGRWKKYLSDNDCSKIIENNRLVAEEWGYNIS